MHHGFYVAIQLLFTRYEGDYFTRTVNHFQSYYNNNIVTSYILRINKGTRKRQVESFRCTEEQTRLQ